MLNLQILLSRLLRVEPDFRWGAAILVLSLASLVLSGAAILRSAEYDEGYSVFVTSGVARPNWPARVFTPDEMRAYFVTRTDAATTARLLRETDVHPPLYFWALGAWRGVAGDGLLALRGFSILCALAALLAWMVVAQRSSLPPVAVGLLLTLAFGFGYTGHIARGFALAHLMIALVTLAALEAWRRAREAGGTAIRWATLAGLAAGLASFTNYLAVFPVAAVLAWLVLATSGWSTRLRVALAAGVPFLLVLLGDLYFFFAQNGSRTGQFEPFTLTSAVQRLAQFNAANLFGALPLYVEGTARTVLSRTLALLLLATALAVGWVLRRMGSARWLWPLGLAAPSLGLLALGAAFDTMPIELRYVAFGTPFAAALVGGASAAWARTAPGVATAGFAMFLLVEAAGTVGMMLHPASRQPFRDAMAAVASYLGDESVLLVPFGNDGVGITATLLRESRPDQKLLVLRRSDASEAPDRAAGSRRAVLMGIADRDGIEQVRAAADALRADAAWHNLGVVWRDFRGGFAEVFERAKPGEGGSR